MAKQRKLQEAKEARQLKLKNSIFQQTASASTRLGEGGVREASLTVGGLQESGVSDPGTTVQGDDTGAGLTAPAVLVAAPAGGPGLTAADAGGE